jgi:hypothetical protein
VTERPVVLPPRIKGDESVPITPFLNDSEFTPELTRAAKVAFEMTRVALRLPDNNHPIIVVAAKRVAELAKAGESDPDRICEQVLSEIRSWHFQQSRAASASGTRSPPAV